MNKEPVLQDESENLIVYASNIADMLKNEKTIEHNNDGILDLEKFIENNDNKDQIFQENDDKQLKNLPENQAQKNQYNKDNVNIENKPIECLENNEKIKHKIPHKQLSLRSFSEVSKILSVSKTNQSIINLNLAGSISPFQKHVIIQKDNNEIFVKKIINEILSKIFDRIDSIQTKQNEKETNLKFSVIRIKKSTKHTKIKKSKNEKKLKKSSEINSQSDLEIQNDFVKPFSTNIQDLPYDSEVTSWNIFEYFQEKSVCYKNKLFLIFVLMTYIFDFILCLLELIYFSNSKCLDNRNHFFIYLNFVFTILFKLVALNFTFLEVSKEIFFELPISFAIPSLIFNIMPIFQFPIYVFDYKSCNQRSPVYGLDFSFDFINFLGIVSLIIFTGILIKVCFFIEFQMNRIMRCLWGLLFGIFIIFIVFLNFLNLTLTFSQVDKFVPALFIENMIFWMYVFEACYCFLSKNLAKKEVF